MERATFTLLELHLKQIKPWVFLNPIHAYQGWLEYLIPPH